MIKTIRPFGFENLQGLAAYDNDRFLIVDSDKGYLATIDSQNNTTIINSETTENFRSVRGIDYLNREIWYVKNRQVLKVADDFSEAPEVFVTLKQKATGVVVTKTEVFVATIHNRISVFENSPDKNPESIREFDSPGVGIDDITFHKKQLWICDSREQIIYCLDPNTGEVQFNLLVPFESPTGIAFLKNELYVSYSNEEVVLEDDGTGEEIHLVSFQRAKNFIHQLRFKHFPDSYFTLSGGYLLEASYVREIDPIEPTEAINDTFESWISLPTHTKRQEVINIKPIGRKFTIENQDDHQYAVFSFDGLKLGERHLFGWQATLKVRAIKYHLPLELEEPLITDEIKEKYLIDDDDLAMDTDRVRKAAREAVQGAKGYIDKVLHIRNYVYEQLTYEIKGGIDSPDIVLRRGSGSCGEYIGVLMALMRLNGIPTRTAGRYKVPYYKMNPETRNVPIEPDFNHVWIEFYVPDYGWIPMESNPDDDPAGKWTMRYFMGLQWYHVELQRGLSFEKIEGIDYLASDLSRKQIRFRILEELEY